MRVQNHPPGPPQRPRPAQKQWTFAGVYHTSNIDYSFLRSVSCMQEVDPTHTNMVMEVYRDGTPRSDTGKGISAARQRQLTLQAAASGVVGAGGLVGAGALAGTHPWAAAALGVVGLVGASLASRALTERSQPIRSEGLPHPWHQEPLWPDTRTLELTASPGRSKVRLDSPQIQSLPLQLPAPTELGQRLADNLKAFPSQHTALVLGAHGVAYKSWSEYSSDEVASLLKTTSEGIGKRIDLVFFDSCLMGNLEALRKFAPYVRYAVASEQVLYTSDRPWQLALDDLGGARGGPLEMGRSLVKAMGSHNEMVTLSLVDLDKVEPLAQAVEGLAEKLMQKTPEEVAPSLNVHAFGPYAATRWEVVGDLGQILDRLDEKGTCPEEVENCRTALQAAVNLHKTRGGYDFSQGLSVQIPSEGFWAEDYRKATGMKQWGKLLATVSPGNEPEKRHLWNHGQHL